MLEGLPLTLFDLFVVAVIGLSALVGLASGAASAILGLASWIGTAVVAVWYGPAATPFVRQAGAPEGFAELIAVAGVFVVVLIVLKVVSSLIARAIAGSFLGGIDRLLGLAFGVVRGAVIVCVLYLVASQFMRPDAQPPWMSQALLIEPVRQGAALIARYLPEPAASPPVTQVMAAAAGMRMVR